jgi:glycosyltransferase 2 family protein
VMMAAGGLLAFVTLTFGPSGAAMMDTPRLGPIPAMKLPLGIGGLAMGLGFLVLVLPIVFPRLSTLARMPFPDVGPDALPRLSWRLLGEGAALSLAGWVAMGLSQVAILLALSPNGLAPSLWPAAIGSVALATVAGFAVPVSPGGLGVREWVLWTSLGSVIDKDLAVLASLGLRLSWVAAEVAAGIALALIRPRALPVGAPAR